MLATSTDAGAAGGPDLDLFRDSASPAASDVIGRVLYTGRDSVANKQTYASDRTVVLDAKSGSEDAKRVIATVVAGIEADRLHFGAGTWMDGTTGGDPGVGIFSAVEFQQNGAPVRPLILGTAVASTSGTAIDFTGLPVGEKMIVVNFVGVSTNGTNSWLVQIGDSGGIENTGYLGTSNIAFAGGNDIGNYTTAFGIRANSASSVMHGPLVLTLVSTVTNTWTASASLGWSNGASLTTSGGSKSLSATLDWLRITTTGGTDTFDAGSTSCMDCETMRYEHNLATVETTELPDLPPSPPEPVVVPERVTARQFKLQLLAGGMLGTVEAWVATQSKAVQIAYANSGTFVRDEPMMQAGFAALGLTSEQGDMFFAAAALEPA